MKVSKVVLVVIALHVLVIGGIFVFEGCSRSKTPSTLVADNESTTPDATTADAGSLTGAMPDITQLTPTTMAPAGLTPTAPTQGITAMAPTGPLTLTTPVAPTPVETPARTYTVRSGDSLWKISRSEKVDMAALARANNLTKSSILKIGQVLTIPAATPATTTLVSADATAIPTTASVDTGSAGYTVRAGDSLWKIARSHNTSVAAIKQANNLSGDNIRVGQKLNIPTASAASTAPISADTAIHASLGTSEYRDPGTYTENGQTVHFVDNGESPAIIAKKYGVRTDDLMRANNITDPRRLQYGQRLVIPTAAPAATAIPAAPVAPMAPTISSPASTPSAAATETSPTPDLAAPVVSRVSATIR